MLFIARFEDDPEAARIRDEQTGNHYAFLAEHSEQILVAGALREKAGGPSVGALWIMDVPDRAAAEAIIDDDPFWINGLRRSRSLLLWSRAVPDHPVTI
ncbi:MAG: YciI family protein [Acidimicrobiia bacterium]|jgi:hypothetical protein